MICSQDKKNQITIVVGDTLNKNFQVTGINLYLIKDLYFICSDLNVNKRLEKCYYDYGLGYLLNISSEETNLFKPCVTDYDIKMLLIDNSVYTISYRNSFIVNKNKNNL